MELWIRSQDRKYLISDSQLGYHEKNGQHSILAYIRDEYRVIGTYKTEKRALEVLDEIQSILSGKCILKSYDNVTPEFGENIIIKPCEVHIEQLNTYVYEMPKE